MQIQKLVLALMGMAAVTEATAINLNRHDVLMSRQNKGGFGGGKGQGGNNGGQAAAAKAAADKAAADKAAADKSTAAAAAKNGGGNNNNNNNNAAGSNCLAANAVQTGSASTGQQNGVAADGQVNSKTDENNFINVCAGKTLTNGLQTKTGSCNGIPMGDIPATTKMVSTVIINPVAGTAVTPNKSFNVTVKVANMQLGSFTNATSTYYTAPQALSGAGTIIGHTHVTIQDMGNTLAPQTPLDATQFAFFKGINDDGNGAGTLTTEVTDGLPAGNYRVCTMSSASNHQPVLMPVAQRGAQDDCTKFTVGGGGGGGGGNANNAAAGGNAAKAGAANNAAAGGNAAKAGAAKAGGKGNSNVQVQSIADPSADVTPPSSAAVTPSSSAKSSPKSPSAQSITSNNATAPADTGKTSGTQCSNSKKGKETSFGASSNCTSSGSSR